MEKRVMTLEPGLAEVASYFLTDALEAGLSLHNWTNIILSEDACLGVHIMTWEIVDRPRKINERVEDLPQKIQDFIKSIRDDDGSPKVEAFVDGIHKSHLIITLYYHY